MSLRFIYGRAGSGKSHFCLKQIKQKIDNGVSAPLILIVPEQFSFQSEKNLLTTVGESGIIKAEVLSFRRMAFHVFNEVGGLTLKHMNASGRSMLIYNIIQENSDKLKIFTKAAKRQGFATIISDMITEFKRYNITPQLLSDCSCNIEEETLKNKLEDLSLIFGEFEQRLHKGYIDSEDDLTILTQKIELSHQFDGAYIWVDEFASFTPQEYEVLKKLFIKAKEITITLCADNLKNEQDGSELFYPTLKTEQRLLKIIEEGNIKYEKPLFLDFEPPIRFAASSELAHLEKNIFSYPFKEYKGETTDISIYKALNKYTEIEETARDIVRLCRDEKLRYKDIAVISGNLDGYQKLISAIFSQYEIPYFIDKKREISSNPLIILIISAVEILAKNWPYEAVFRYLKTGLIDIRPDEVDLIENFVLSTGIRGKRWTQEENWEISSSGFETYEGKSEYDLTSIDKINRARIKIISPLIKLNGSIQGKKTARQMCEALYNFLCELNVPEKLEKWIMDFKKTKQVELADEYSKIWNIIIDVMDQIVEVIGEQVISSDQFEKILLTGFGEYEIGLIPPALDQVLVGSIQRLRSHDISYLYIVGVNDGIFPSPQSDEGMLTDSDRFAIQETGLEIAKDTRSKAFEAEFLVYSTMTKASKYMRLSFPLGDIDGKTMRPSIIISRLKKIFPGIKQESSINESLKKDGDISKVAGPKGTFNELISQLRKKSDGEILSPIWLEVYRWYSKDPSWQRTLKTVMEGFSYTNSIEYLSSSKVKKLYGKNMNISVSRLEKFAQCPFEYFMQYGMKARERKVYKLSAPDIGTFMHVVLSNFSNMLVDKKISWDDIDGSFAQEEISKIIDKQLTDSPIFSSNARYMHMTQNMKRILKRSVYLIAEHIKRGGFKPLGYEMGFGSGAAFPPISVKLSGTDTVNLVGRIDRVDLYSRENETYIRIVDYKSSAKDLKLSDVYYGFQLQLLVYLDAIMQEIGISEDTKSMPGGILYFRIDDPIVRATNDMTDEDIEVFIKKALKMKGLLIEDQSIIKEMDREISGRSDIIPAALKNDGSFMSASQIATIEQFDILRKYVRKAISSTCEKILGGDIEISPYKKGQTSSCTYCSYSSVCQFDTSLSGSHFRILIDKKNDEIFTLMENDPR